MSPNPKTELAFIKIYDSWKVQSARFRKRTPFCRYMAEALEAGEIPGYPGEAADCIDQLTKMNVDLMARLASAESDGLVAAADKEHYYKAAVTIEADIIKACCEILGLQDDEIGDHVSQTMVALVATRIAKQAALIGHPIMQATLGMNRHHDELTQLWREATDDAK